MDLVHHVQEEEEEWRTQGEIVCKGSFVPLVVFYSLLLMHHGYVHTH